MNLEHCLVEREGQVLVVTLNRRRSPSSRDPLTQEPP